MLGHAWNTAIYPVTVAGGEEKTVSVMNDAFFYEGRILHKTDAQSGKPVAGAIFRITAKKKNVGELAAWYFKTDKTGYIAYDEAHYLGSWGGEKSDPLFYYQKGRPALPASITLTAVEVEAPAGYVLSSGSASGSLKSSDNVHH